MFPLADNRDFSDCVDVQADLSLRWAHVRRYVFSLCDSIILSADSDASGQTVHIMYNHYENMPIQIY